MSRTVPRLLVSFGVVLLLLAGLERQGNDSSSVQAHQNDAIAQQIRSSDGGMASYGSGIEGATSLPATQQAVSRWSSYTHARSAWGFSTTSVSRLANADWHARQAGPPAITAQQMAGAVNHLIATKLGAMTAQQQLALYSQMMFEETPKGRIYSPNSGTYDVTAVTNANGTYTVTVSPAAFSKRKGFFQQKAPGMVSSYSSFYPAEASIVFYSLASGDQGYGNDYLNKIKKKIGDVTGLDMTNRSLFGDNGYLARRPLSVFCDQAGMDQFFTDLGF